MSQIVEYTDEIAVISKNPNDLMEKLTNISEEAKNRSNNKSKEKEIYE